MLAAALFFRADGSGEGLPYLREYLLCLDFGWTWQELQATPAAIVAYWMVYRNMRLAAEARRAER